MECGYARLTVFFEDPFWVGVYEREESGRVVACKVTFGAEPRDYQVYAWLLQEWRALAFSPGVAAPPRQGREANPKRRQRAAAAQLQKSGVGTKAQQALQLQREQAKTERQARRRDRDAQAEARKFALRQAKKREKHRGH